MKFSENKFTIDKDYAENLSNKMDVFRTVTGTNKALQLIFISSYGLKQNMYSSRVQGEVTLDDLFKRNK